MITSNKNIGLFSGVVLIPSLYRFINYPKLWKAYSENHYQQHLINLLKKNNAWNRYIQLNVNNYIEPTNVKKIIFSEANYQYIMDNLKKKEYKLKFILSLPGVVKTSLGCLCLYTANNMCQIFLTR